MTLIMALVSEVLTTVSFRMAKRAFSFFSYPSDEMQGSKKYVVVFSSSVSCIRLVLSSLRFVLTY